MISLYLQLVLGLICGGVTSTAPTYTWDLRGSRDLASLSGVNSTPVGRYIDLVGPATIRVTFTDGRTFAEDVVAIDLRIEGQIVNGVGFHLAPMSAEKTYQKSLELARAWGLDEDPLHAWYEHHKQGRRKLAATMFNNTTMPVHLGIFKAYDGQNNYRIVFDVGWMTEEELADIRAATQPATANASDGR